MRLKLALGISLLAAMIFAGCATENVVQKPGYAVLKVNRNLYDQWGHETEQVGNLKEEAVYQYDLRHSPNNQFGCRFHIKWKAPRGTAQVRLVLDVRGLNDNNETALDQFTVSRSLVDDWAEWSTIDIGGPQFKKLGTIMAWRVSIYNRDRVMAELPSGNWYSDIRAEPSVRTESPAEPPVK